MTKLAPLVLPALRGYFGDWVYYACLMSSADIAARVNFADELHTETALSSLIQRRLEGSRAKHIAGYLSSTEERFFNSLVLATYGGTPEWLEVGNFQATTRADILSQISEGALESLGFLSLSGTSRIFAVDGQHRLAGIKKALEDGVDISEEQLPVIFVAHKKTKAGLERTRRLFTTLNKTAVAVQKSDIIALDEDDAMAIIARRLVETNAAFRDPKIAVISSLSIPVNNHVCLTTISTLYDILKQLFMFDRGQRTERGLRFNRPSDERLDHFYEVATSYFSALASAFKPVGALFASSQPGQVTSKQRGSHGGHLLFRSVGLDIVTRTAIEYAREKHVTLSEAVAHMGRLPTELAETPYMGVIWHPTKKKLIFSGKQVARELIRYMVGLQTDSDALTEAYSRALGRDEGAPTPRLPGQIV